MTIGFLLLLLVLWVRAPHFEINPAAAAGFSGILGFNVGHAIVFGPIIVLAALAMLAGMLTRREALRQSFYLDLASGLYGDNKLSTGTRLVLDKFSRPGTSWSAAEVADRAIRTLWFFILPMGVSAICIRRYVDFIPEPDVVSFAESKAWSLWTRIELHLLSGRLWEVRPVLPDHYLDENPLISGQMPYIYSPLQGWLYLALFAVSLMIAIKSWVLYFHASPFASSAIAAQPLDPVPTLAPPPAV